MVACAASSATVWSEASDDFRRREVADVRRVLGGEGPANHGITFFNTVRAMVAALDFIESSALPLVVTTSGLSDEVGPTRDPSAARNSARQQVVVESGPPELFSGTADLAAGVGERELQPSVRRATALPAAHGSVGDQSPPLSRTDLRPVWDIVIGDVSGHLFGTSGHDARVAHELLVDMRARDQVGRSRYGIPLTAHNGRDQVVDLYQELLDAAAYARAGIEEGRYGLTKQYWEIVEMLIEIRGMIGAPFEVMP
jgi:hypothetical protein